jgi:hypothetical protein
MTFVYVMLVCTQVKINFFACEPIGVFDSASLCAMERGRDSEQFSYECRKFPIHVRKE